MNPTNLLQKQPDKLTMPDPKSFREEYPDGRAPLGRFEPLNVLLADLEGVHRNLFAITPMGEEKQVSIYFSMTLDDVRYKISLSRSTKSGKWHTLDDPTETPLSLFFKRDEINVDRFHVTAFHRGLKVMDTDPYDLSHYRSSAVDIQLILPAVKKMLAFEQSYLEKVRRDLGFGTDKMLTEEGWIARGNKAHF